MIHFPKSQPPPHCLALEKQKTTGTYRCDGVATQLKNDFKNKCYLCEQRAPTSINIEHFIPHRGDRDLMFDWNNLFFCCAHCNNIKAAWETKTTINGLLDCTNEDHHVDTVLDYSLEVSNSQGALSKENVLISPRQDDDCVRNTAQLLNEIFQGTTEQKVIESSNLRELLLGEMRALTDLLSKFLQAKTLRLQQLRKQQILKELQADSAFTAFKRCLVRKHHRFAQWLEDAVL